MLSNLPFVEYLGMEPAMLTDSEQTEMAPVVLVTVRPQLQQSFASFTFPITVVAALRMRDDLDSLLYQLVRWVG